MKIMKIILSNEEMQAVDLFTINEFGIPGKMLMENAGKACFDEMSKNIKKTDKVCVVAGAGNNGGDGFVITRYLFQNNFNVSLFLSVTEEKLKGDAKWHFDLLKKSSFNQFEEKIEANIVIDALFGTGFSGKARPPFDQIISEVNYSNAQIYSIDIPSGVSGNSGKTKGEFVNADKVFTIGNYKKGFFLEKGLHFLQKTKVLDIGFPKIAYKNSKKTYFVEKKDIVLKNRKLDSHKGNFGKIAVFGGDKGMEGAAQLSGLAALKSGSGLVKLSSESQNIFPELIYFKITDFENLRNFIEWADAIAIGMGLGNDDNILIYLENILKSGKKAVIDADGINFFQKEWLKNIENIVFTPHLMEFSRLLQTDIEKIKEDKIEYVRKFCLKFKTNLLLKGKVSIYGNKSGEIYLMTTGNSALATAGSGDILSGMIASFLGQNYELDQAVIFACYLHGLAGEFASEEFGEESVIASDIINYISKAMFHVKHYSF
jgi:NAD(P)H-hydrate epimerase